MVAMVQLPSLINALQIDWGEEPTEQQGGDNVISEIDFGDIDFNSISLEGISTEEVVSEQYTASSEGYDLFHVVVMEPWVWI